MPEIAVSALFTKACRLKKCQKTFTTERARQPFCSDACRERAKVLSQRRRKRRRQYVQERPELLAASLSRRQAREMAIARQPIRCQRCSELYTIAEVELHHVNGDPHWNPVDGNNWAWLCKPCHAVSDEEWRTARLFNSGIVDPRRYSTYVGDVVALPSRVLSPAELRWS